MRAGDDVHVMFWSSLWQLPCPLMSRLTLTDVCNPSILCLLNIIGGSREGRTSSLFVSGCHGVLGVCMFAEQRVTTIDLTDSSEAELSPSARGSVC